MSKKDCNCPCGSRLNGVNLLSTTSVASSDGHHNTVIEISKIVQEKIATLYDLQICSDLTLEVNGERFQVHRFILCSYSDVFKVMLNKEWSDSDNKIISLTEHPACAGIFAKFIKFMYTGQLIVNPVSLLPYLILGDKYNVKELVDICLHYMLKNLVAAARHNQLILWLQYSLNCGHSIVHNACINFIACNFEYVLNTEDIGSFEKDVLITFLKKSDLVVRDEVTLFEYLVKWLNIQQRKLLEIYNEAELKNNFKHLVSLMMSYIRFPMMSLRDLGGLLFHPLFKPFKDIFIEKISTGVAFHCNKFSSALPKEILFTPRLYTHEGMSVSHCIERYNEFPMFGVQTLIFSTPASFADWQCNHSFEWNIDLFPKGIKFEKCLFNSQIGTLVIPESLNRTFRISICHKSLEESARVSIGILIYGKEEGLEYVRKVVQKKFIFSCNEVLNLDDLVPYEDLNNPCVISPFLIGSNSDCLKIRIVITPLCSL